MLRFSLFFLLLISTVLSLQCHKGVSRKASEGGDADIKLVDCPEAKGNEDLCCTKHWTASISGIYGCRRRCPSFSGKEWCTSNTCYCRDGSGRCDPKVLPPPS